MTGTRKVERALRWKTLCLGWGFQTSFVVLRQRLTLCFRLVWPALNLDQSSCLSHLCAGIKDVSHQVHLCTSFLKAMEKQGVFESEQMGQICRWKHHVWTLGGCWGREKEDRHRGPWGDKHLTHGVNGSWAGPWSLSQGVPKALTVLRTGVDFSSPPGGSLLSYLPPG